MTVDPRQSDLAHAADGLFDADHALPPHDAIELYHEPPPVLSMIHTIITTAGGDDPHGWAPATHNAWAASRDAAIKALREHLYIKVGTHYPQQLGNSVGKHWPARLRISWISHLCHPETEPFAQMHDHIYIHPTAYPDNTPTSPTLPLPEWEATQPWPIDRYSLAHETADMVAAMSGIAAQNTFTELTGASWTTIRHTNLPPTLKGFEADTQTYPRFICPGPKRAAPNVPTSWRDFHAAKIAEDPGRWNDMSDEQRWQFKFDTQLEFGRIWNVDRVILLDRVYPRLRDLIPDDDR